MTNTFPKPYINTIPAMSHGLYVFDKVVCNTDNGADRVVVLAVCKCGAVQSLLVEPCDLHSWQSGMLAQNAFPYLSEAEREAMISQTCPACWEAIAAEVPEDWFGDDQ